MAIEKVRIYIIKIESVKIEREVSKVAHFDVVVVGGGIRDAKSAYTAAKAGGDIIVTGTIVEETSDVKAKIQEITGAIKKASME